MFNFIFKEKFSILKDIHSVITSKYKSPDITNELKKKSKKSKKSEKNKNFKINYNYTWGRPALDDNYDMYRDGFSFFFKKRKNNNAYMHYYNQNNKNNNDKKIYKQKKKKGFLGILSSFLFKNPFFYEIYTFFPLHFILFFELIILYYWVYNVFFKCFIWSFWLKFLHFFQNFAVFSQVPQFQNWLIYTALNNYIYFFWIEVSLCLFYLIFLIILIFYFFILKCYDLTTWKDFNHYKLFYGSLIFFIFIIIYLNFYLILPCLKIFFTHYRYPVVVSFSNDFYISMLNMLLKSVILITFVWWLWTALIYLKNKSSIYFSLFLFTLTFISVIVSLIMISSANLIIIYITMEIQSLCFYVLAAWNDKFEIKGAESSLKYLFLGGFSSNLFLFGTALIYASFDTVRFFEIMLLFTMSSFNTEPIAYIGFCFLTFGILFKLAIVPFHFWIADVYEGSHWLVVSFFAIIPKLPYIFLLIQLWHHLFNPFLYILYLKEIWIFLSIISILYGCVFMLYASNLGRIAAYSSIINMGFIFFSMACGWNLTFILFYIFSYLFQLFLFFVIIVYSRISYLHDLQDLFHKNSFLAFSLTIALFSLMGIPPFAGFCAKILLVNSFISNGEFFLSFIFVFLSVITAVPYLRLIRMLYSFVNKKTIKDITFNNKFTYFDMLWLTCLLILNIFFICFVNSLLLFINFFIY